MKKAKKPFILVATAVAVSAAFLAIISPATLAQVIEGLRSQIGAVLNLDDPRPESAVVPDAQVTALSSFHFLPPLAPASGDPSRFDPLLLNQLTVEVCEVVAGGGCTVIRTFTAQGTSSERLRIDKGYYTVNWDTSRVALNNKTYRVRVSLPRLELGSVDLTPDVYTRFGRTWPIKFLVDKDPAFRVRQLRSLGRSASQIANVLKTEFNLTREQIAALLAGDVEPFTADEIAVALDGVFQDVIVPFTTKVTDDATRNAMTSYDPGTGKMTFITDTPQLRNLNIGDVMVSEPGGVAPAGYLRKVTSIRRSGGGYVVETVQAQINEAVSQGTLKASGQLKPAGVASSSTARRVTETDKTAGDEKGAPDERDAVDAGDSFDFHRDIDVTIDLAGSGGGATGTGNVRVQGSIDFNASYDFGMGVEVCEEVPPVCVDRVEAHVDVTQKSNIRVTGQFDGMVHKEKTIDTIRFAPITFFIGPIPVVIVPKIDVVAGVDGEAHVNFRFAAEAQSTLKLGAKWTDPDDGGVGWEDIKEFTPLAGRITESELNANLKVEGYSKANAKLLLYDVAGPGVDGRIGLLIDVHLGQKPLWVLSGHLVADVNFSADIEGVIDLGTYTKNLLDLKFRLAEAANQAPQCSWSSSPISANVGVAKTLGPGTGFDGFFQCTDPEGEAISYSANSIADGTIATDVGLIRYAFADAGVRTVNVTAKDASGGTASFSLTVDVRNSLPIVRIFTSTNTVPATAQYFVTATAFDPEAGAIDPNLGFLSCDRIRFYASPNATVTPSGPGCGATIVFGTPGPATVTVTGTDVNNGVGTNSVSVTVGPEPVNHPPVISTMFYRVYAYRGPFSITCPDPNYYCYAPPNSVLFNGEAGSGNYYPPMLLDIAATDQDGDQLTVTWHCATGTQEAVVGYDPLYQLPTCQPIYNPNNSTILIWATVSDGVNVIQGSAFNYFMPQRTN